MASCMGGSFSDCENLRAPSLNNACSMDIWVVHSCIVPLILMVTLSTSCLVAPLSCFNILPERLDSSMSYLDLYSARSDRLFSFALSTISLCSILQSSEAAQVDFLSFFLTFCTSLMRSGVDFLNAFFKPAWRIMRRSLCNLAFLDGLLHHLRSKRHA